MSTVVLPIAGQRVELLAMPGDPHPIPRGTQGTVRSVQHVLGDNHITVAWDNGRSLSLVGSVDKWINLK